MWNGCPAEFYIDAEEYQKGSEQFGFTTEAVFMFAKPPLHLSLYICRGAL